VPVSEDRRLITRVALRNYKSIAACDISPAQLTFLVGPNGSGKSNFLDALRFVADSLRFSLDHALRDRGGIKEVRRRSGGHPNHFGIRIDFSLGGTTGSYAFRIGAGAAGAHRIQREECFVLSADGGEHHYYRTESGKLVGSSFRQAAPVPAADRLYLVSVSGVDAFRPVYDALSGTGFYNLRPESIREMQPPDPGEILNRDGSNIASVVARLGRRSPHVKERVENYLGQIVPGLSGMRRVSAGPRETLEFRQQVRGARHPWRFYASSMSDGTLRAGGVLLSLFQRAGHASSKRWLVGIEEPEVALHPAAVAVLADSLRDAAEHTQVLVTSHSTDLLEDPEISADSIVAVLARDGETRMGPLDEVGRSALRDHLYTAGELLRMDQLDPDPNLANLNPNQLDLFGSSR